MQIVFQWLPNVSAVIFAALLMMYNRHRRRAVEKQQRHAEPSTGRAVQVWVSAVKWCCCDACLGVASQSRPGFLLPPREFCYLPPVPAWPTCVCTLAPATYGAFMVFDLPAEPPVPSSLNLALLKPMHFPQFKRVLSYQLPPRGFWSYWCDGLSVLDLLLVLFYLGLNIAWLYETYKRTFKGVDGERTY